MAGAKDMETAREDLGRELREGALELGMSLDERAVERFSRFLAELRRWGAKINLTGPATARDIVRRHFLDSLSLLPLLRELKCRKVLDLGSGAGFPGLALKIAAPALEVTLLDSREKRVFLLRHVIRTLGLGEGIRVVRCRAEETPGDLVRAFDCVTARAFAPLTRLLPLAAPYLRSGGVVIAMKGPAGLEETEGLDLEPLGLEGPRVQRIRLPFEGREGIFVIFKKT